MFEILIRETVKKQVLALALDGEKRDGIFHLKLSDGFLEGHFPEEKTNQQIKFHLFFCFCFYGFPKALLNH